MNRVAVLDLHLCPPQVTPAPCGPRLHRSSWFRVQTGISQWFLTTASTMISISGASKVMDDGC